MRILGETKKLREICKRGIEEKVVGRYVKRKRMMNEKKECRNNRRNRKFLVRKAEPISSNGHIIVLFSEGK